MESIFVYVLNYTTFLILIISIFILYFSVFKTKIRCSSLYNIPPGKNGWPIIGETLEYVSNNQKFVWDRMMKYSPDVFKTSIIGEKVAVLCGPSANKFIFSNETNLFKFWLPPSVAAILSVTNIDTNSSSSRLVTEELHKFLKLYSMQYLVPIMDSKAQQHLQSFWVPDNEVKVHLLAKEFTFALSCCLFLDYHKSEQVTGISEPFYVLNEGAVAMPINFPGTLYYKARKREAELRSKLVDEIRQRKIELSRKNHGGFDLLTRVLMASQENGVMIDETVVAGRIISLLFASFFTTSNTITFVIDNLAKYPHVYEKVLQEQLEIARSKEAGELLTWKDVQKMKYSWNAVCETMRLEPPAQGSFRETITDVTYAGFKIPKGWKVHWNNHSTNMDPKIFPDPEKFDPTRFESNKVPPFAFVPFGAGPRMCAGKEYTRIEILVFLHNVVTKFKLHKINPNEKVIYNPNPHPVEGLRIHIQPHEN
ncbi:beta-amyrin 28-oxidase-like [Chenopodium quinoa]|uniref:beta-amyrin 28-monooxygenase n=1 Tax=Chenopodium quinoa TaxID=63459 RepID=A0A803M534_CHEQI|nr:beta-amyrin 28-oxidase-like [Chenopodium quinoa]